MAAYGHLIPTKTLTVKKTAEEIQTSIKEVSRSFIDYTLLEEDTLLNRYRLLIKETDAVSKLSMDMGQHLDSTLNETSPETTQIFLEIRRVNGLIDQTYEVNRAARSLDTFLTLLSKALQGKLHEVVTQRIEQDRQSQENDKKTSRWLLVIIIVILLATVIDILQARNNRVGMGPVIKVEKTAGILQV